jgi:hypothetical protein
MVSFTHAFVDARLDRRADSFFNALTALRCVSVRRLSETRAEQIAFYRLLNNDALTHEALSGVLSGRAAELAGSVNHVLAIQDTTQFNFEAHARRLGKNSGLGVIGDNASLGFFLHPTLVVDADTGHARGISHLRLWTREADRPNAQTRRHLGIEEKESFRWIESVVRSRDVLPQGTMVTTVADRESDIYDLYYRLPENCDVLARSRGDRRVVGGPLFKSLATAPVSGEAVVLLRGDARRNTEPREAHLRYRHCAVRVLQPETCRDPEAPPDVALWAIEVVEAAESVPEGARPVHWRLLTTHPVAACRSNPSGLRPRLSTDLCVAKCSP